MIYSYKYIFQFHPRGKKEGKFQNVKNTNVLNIGILTKWRALRDSNPQPSDSKSATLSD